MIGVVVVSHSAKLAEGVCELAGQVAQGRVRLAAAGGTADPEDPIGTDAFKVLAAIEAVYSEDGVLVLMDLGSAVLSAETALELLDEEKRGRVHLCAAPLVEGAVAAVSQAAAGAEVAEIVREAQNALAGKVAQLGAGSAGQVAPQPEKAAGERLVTLPNRLGLHARPAAHLIRLARRFDARITITNVTRRSGPVEAASINGVLGLGARQGHQLLFEAQGPDARRAVSELAAFVESGCGDKEETPAAEPRAQQASAGQFTGIPVAAGIAVAPLKRLRPAAIEAAHRLADEPEAEWQRLLAALRGAQDETRSLYEWARVHAGEDKAGIFDAQLLFLEDPALTGSASRIIFDERANVEFAWQTAANSMIEQFTALSDPYLRARAADVADVATRVMRRLTGAGAAVPATGQPCIIGAHDLTPSEVKEMDPTVVLGVCLEAGSASAHSAILARAMGIPAVVGLGPAISALAEGTILALDGERGIVWVSPGADQVRALENRRREWLDARHAARSERHKPVCTRDGRRIRVLANINSVAGAAEALESGADGVGVLRTEFLFLGRAEAPGEEEQFAAYRAIAEVLCERPLVIRTLDIGGDKNLPYIEIGQEANPFLGWRGIRVTLSLRDLLRTQLRAILRAGAGRPVEVLFPMISSVAEFREAKAVLGEVRAELELERVPFHKDIKAGAMIEVPSAVAIADQLAAEASFFSIGTNDLTQYVMAADRTNTRVAPIANPLQPAVLRMVRDAVEAARRAGIGVTLCGELAADTLAAPLLIGLGLEEFSVSAPLVPEVKRAVAQCSLPEAEAIAREALVLDSSEAVRRFLSR